MVEIRIEYEGELHCSSTHGPSGAVLATDAPVDNCGRGASFSPTDLLATALGSCMLTIMGIAADKRGWSIEGTRARVVKTMTAEGPRRVARLEVDIDVAGKHTDAARRVLEQAARTCPVALSLRAELEVVLRLAWDGAPVPG